MLTLPRNLKIVSAIPIWLGVVGVSGLVLAAETSVPNPLITQVTGELNKLEGRRFSFVRPLPFMEFRNVQVPIKLPEGLSGGAQPYVEDPLLHGENETSGAKAQVEMFASHGAYSDLVIRVNNLARAGDFDLPVILTSGDRAPQRFTLNIRASDGPLVPLLVVCTGVMAGMYSRYLARQRPLQQFLARSARVRGRVRRLQERVRKGSPKSAELGELAQTLEEVKIDTSFDEVDRLGTRLDTVVGKLEAIERQQSEQRVTLNRSVNEAFDNIQDERYRWIDPTDVETKRLDELNSTLTTIRKALEEDRLEEVETELRNWTWNFGRILIERVTRLLSEIRVRAQNLSEQDQTRIEEAARPVKQLLDLDPRMLVQRINDLKTAVSGLEREASARTVILPLTEEAAGRRPRRRNELERTESGASGDQAAEGAAVRRLQWSILGFATLSAAVAILTGWPTIYSGKAFGSLADYITAFVWGFGLDAATRGLLDIRANSNQGAIQS